MWQAALDPVQRGILSFEHSCIDLSESQTFCQHPVKPSSWSWGLLWQDDLFPHPGKEIKPNGASQITHWFMNASVSCIIISYWLNLEIPTSLLNLEIPTSPPPEPSLPQSSLDIHFTLHQCCHTARNRQLPAVQIRSHTSETGPSSFHCWNSAGTS